MTMQLLPAGLARGELEVVIRLAGQGAPLVRSRPAMRLVDELVAEAEEVMVSLGAGW
jgi:hypothetical protein